MPQGSEQADAAIKRLEQIAAATAREVQRLLRRLDTQPGSSRLLSDTLAMSNNAEVLRQVRRAIADLRTQTLTVAAEAAAAAATAEGSALGVTFEPRVAALIRAIVDDRLTEITAVFGAADDALAKAGRIAVFTSADTNKLVDEVARVLSSTRSRAASAIDSVAMAAGRQMTLLDAEGAGARTGTEMVYGYGGPIDDIARPFCREHHTRLTGQVYTFAALNRLDNGVGQPKPVSVHLGGFNCRHNLQPMTRAEAESRGLTVVE